MCDLWYNDRSLAPVYSVMTITPGTTGPQVSMTATMTDAPPKEVNASSLTALPREVFDGGEIVLLAVKPSMWRPVFESLPWLVTSVLTALALAWFRLSFAGLSLTTTSQVILLVAVARLGLAVLHWIPTWYVLTNRRILTIRGVRRPKVLASPLLDISEVRLGSALLERVVNIGTIHFHTDDAHRPRFSWDAVSKPDALRIEIVRAVENAHHHRR